MNKPKNTKSNLWKKDNRGVTYVELVVAIALLSGVLLVGYTFLSYTYRSLIFNQGKYDLTQDARIAMIELGDNIRKSHSTAVDGKLHKGVEVHNDGYRIDIYVDLDGDGVLELARYKVEANKLVYGKAELGKQPTEWKTVINSLYNHRLTQPKAIFEIDGSKVNIEIYTKDGFENLSEPVCISASYTVRSKGGM